MNNKILTTVIASSLMLASCSGSKSGGAGGAAAGAGSGVVNESATATATPGYLGGTAAVGAPLGLASVLIKTTAGVCATGKTNSLGVYSLDVSACTGPFFVKVKSQIGEVSTLAQAAGEIVNVTPLTQLIAQRAVGSKDLSAVNLAAQTTLKADMIAKQAEVRTFLNEYAKAIGAVTDLTSVDLMNGSFAADGAGVDKLLDLVKIKDKDGANDDVVITVGAGTTFDYSVDNSHDAPDAITTSAATNFAGQVTEKHEILNKARKITKDFSDAFKNGRPSRAVFDQYLDSSFLHQGKGVEYTYEDLDGDDVKGIQFKNVVILNDNPSDFWIAFQIMGIENGKYALWNTWASKVDLTTGKILGNRLPLGLYPAFIKPTWINSSNVSTPDSSQFRILEIGGSQNVSSMVISKLNDKALYDATAQSHSGSISITGGGVSGSDQQHRFDNRFAEMIVLHPNDGTLALSKVTFRANGATEDSISYIYIPQAADEDVSQYVQLTYPPFTSVSTAGADCSYHRDSFPKFDNFTLSKQDFDLEGFEMYFENYSPSISNSYPGFSAYKWEDLTEAKYEAKATDFLSKNNSPFLKVGNFAVSAYGDNDIEYHTITICE